MGSYTDDGIPDGESRFYTVAAVNEGGYMGPESAEVSAATYEPPSAPRDLVAETGPGLGQVTLSWAPPENDGG